MGRDRRTGIAALFAAIVIVVLLAAGMYVRSLVAGAFQTTADLANARALTYGSLRFMLDEETGVRGYAATHNPVFLEPYDAARGQFEATVRQLRAVLAEFDDPAANRAADDLLLTNERYLATVAGPLRRAGGNTQATELHGKQLVDHFRGDIVTLDAFLTKRDAIVNAGAAAALNRIVLFTLGAVAVVLLLSLIFINRQTVLSRRLEAEHVAAAEERREADVLRAAYLTEKRIADTLQEAFVQRPLPTHPTFRFSATYVPASEEARVGGDWYDALELPGNRVLFVIGDVTGHGIQAAVTMNRVRQNLISSALLDPTPNTLLERVAHELYLEKTPLVTAVAGYADANTYEFVYATAGHPPPLLIEPGRAPRMLDCGSLPLGAMSDESYRTFRIQSVPGAMLVLYTDGAIEHSRDVIEGEEILLAAAAEAARVEPPEPASFIHNVVFRGREIGDDVAILTVGFAAEPAAGVRISVENTQAAFTGRLAGIAEGRGGSSRARAVLRRMFRGNKAA